jgi:error-prone DNA polymerase
MKLAGFTAGEADLLRRSMSRRRSHEAMAAHWPRFRDGAVARGVSKETAEAVFRKLLAFSEFGFPRSHAVAFARLAYESAYLRHYYPVEYYCALFNNQPMGFYTPGVLTGDARRHGIEVLRPQINRSGTRCTIESDTSFRLGLGSVRGVSAPVAGAVVAEREGEPFRSLFDLVQRTGLHRAAVENLILAGALDEFGLERRELLWQLGLFVGAGRWVRGAQAGGMVRRQLALPLPVEADMVPLRPMSDWEELVADYHSLEFSLSAHPLGVMRRWLGEGLHTSRHIEGAPDDTDVRLAGLVVCRQQPTTAKGVLFLLLEDEFGLTNVVVHPGLAARQRSIVRTEPFVLVDGTVQRRGRTVNVLARAFRSLRPPPDLAAPASRNFH